MVDTLGVAVVHRGKQAFQIVGCLALRKGLLLLLGNHLGQIYARDVLHDHVQKLLIVVSFEVLRDVGVVERVQHGHLFRSRIQNISFTFMGFSFVVDFNRNSQFRVVHSRSLVYLRELALRCSLS